jgi:hypothetical protein
MVKIPAKYLVPNCSILFLQRISDELGCSIRGMETQLIDTHKMIYVLLWNTGMFFLKYRGYIAIFDTQ